MTDPNRIAQLEGEVARLNSELDIAMRQGGTARTELMLENRDLRHKRDTLHAQLVTVTGARDLLMWENEFHKDAISQHLAMRQQAEAELAVVIRIVERLAKQGMDVIQPTQLELDAIATMKDLPAAARALLDELDRHRKAHVLCEAGDPLDTIEQLMDENRKLRDELALVKELCGDNIEYLCEPCNTVHPAKGISLLQECPTCSTTMLPSSYNLRQIADLKAHSTALRGALEAALDSEDFYNLMQTYRHIPVHDQRGTCLAFETVKAFVRDQAALRQGEGEK